MLLLPNKRIWRYQLTFIVILATTLSVMLLVFWLPPIMKDYGRTSTLDEGLTYEKAETPISSAVVFDFLPIIVSSLIFLIGLLILCELLFFWVPSLTDLTLNKSKGRMVWTRKRLGFPERTFSLFETNSKILIRRKRSSLKGLLMREFTMEIHLTLDKADIKRISDFTGIERIIQTPTHNILIKTVVLKCLPLQLIQLRTILASSVMAPLKTILSQKKPV